MASNNAYYIGVDVGTSSARACIIDHEGTLCAVATQDTQTWQSQSGCYEQSTTDIWNSICIAVKAAVKEGNVDANTIQSIAFVATCSLAVFSSDTDEPLSVVGPSFSDNNQNVMLWMHRAAEEEAKAVNATEHKSLRYLGGQVSPLMALPKILWLKKHMPQAVFRRARFFDLHDALAHIATGATITCSTPICNHLLEDRGFGVDGTIKGWADEILKSIDLEELSLKSPKQIGGLCKHEKSPVAGSPIGKLSSQAAHQLGLSGDVVVGSGIIDSYSGWIGTTGAQIEGSDAEEYPLHERLATVAGTSTCHILASTQFNFTDGVWGPYKDFLVPGFKVMEGGQNATGRLISYVLETHPSHNEARNLATSENLTIFDFCNNRLSRMREDTSAPNLAYLARHIFFYGDYFGNRSPYADPAMKGTLVGIDGDTSINNLVLMYYVTLEFIALQARHIISQLNDSGHTIKSIFMSGSLCQNPVLIDLIATVCDMPVIIPKYIKAAVGYGAALLAVKAATQASGKGEDLWSVMNRISKPGKMFKPVVDQYMKQILEVKYQAHLELAEQQKRFRDMIDQIPLPSC